MINRGKSSDSKQIDLSKLCFKLNNAAHKVVDFLESKLQQDGSYGAEAKDLACYFKSPMMFIAANKPKAASAVLTYIKKQFMRSDGDFRTEDHFKSVNPAYTEYLPYMNGWIVKAANILGMTDIVHPGYHYFSKFSMGSFGFLTNEVSET